MEDDKIEFYTAVESIIGSPVYDRARAMAWETFIRQTVVTIRTTTAPMGGTREAWRE